MVMIIELSTEQVESLREANDELRDMEKAGAPGMLIAQIFGNRMKVRVIDNEKGRAMQLVFGPDQVGRTSRMAMPLAASLETGEGKMHEGPCWRNSHADCGC